MSLFGRSRGEQQEWAANEIALGLQIVQGVEATNEDLRRAAQHFQAALTVFTPSAYPQQSAQARAALDAIQQTIALRASVLNDAAKRFGWSAEDVERVRRRVDSSSNR